MKVQVLFLLLLLACMYLCLAQGSYGNCCLGYAPRVRANPNNIESYRIQETDGDCNIRAVVFVIKKKPSHKKQWTVCADPNDRGVRKLMETLDMRMAM